MFEMKHIFDGRLYFHKLAQKYGDIVSCYVGSKWVILNPIQYQFDNLECIPSITMCCDQLKTETYRWKEHEKGE